MNRYLRCDRGKKTRKMNRLCLFEDDKVQEDDDEDLLKTNSHHHLSPENSTNEK